MSEPRCITCWSSGPLEMHHPAGRRNDAMTIPVCKGCHKVLTKWGLVSGIYLEATEDLDKARAAIVGVSHVWALTALLTGRRISRVADSMGDPNREGRHTPDTRRITGDVYDFGEAT